MSELARAETAARTEIMIVDDRPANLQVLVEFLRGEGYKVRPVTTGSAALSVSAQIRPDLVLLDIDMPDLPGFEICRRFKADTALKEVPVLFLSAMTDPADKVRAFEAGGEDYITKPFQMAEVHARISTHLRMARLRRDLAASCAQVEALSTLREHLAHMLVHDMRSPLFGITGMLELAESSPGVRGDPDARGFIAEARRSARNVVEMVSDILDVYKMESGGALASPRPEPLDVLISGAIRLLGGVLDPSRVAFEPMAAPALVRCDPALTRRVLLNLLGNASRYAPSGTRIRVAVEEEPAAFRVSVIDEGPGIRPEDRARMFERFGALDSHGEGRKYSTGLGLVFCKLAVETQGGQIGVESEPGRGCRFWFALPRA